MAESNPTQVILTDDGLKIIKAQNTANEAVGNVNDINSDNKLTPSEKLKLKQEYDKDVELYNIDIEQLKSVDLPTTELETAMSNLTDFVTPLFKEMNRTSTVDRGALDSVFTAFATADKNASQAFVNMVQQVADGAKEAGDDAQKAGEAAKQAADQAQTDATQAKADAATAQQKAQSSIDQLNDATTKFDGEITDAKNNAQKALDNITVVDSKVTKLSASTTAQFNTLNNGYQEVISTVNNMDIGGRNIVLDSSNMGSFRIWQENGNSNLSDDKKEITITTSHGGINIEKKNLSEYLPNKGDTIVISADVKGNSHLQFNYNDGNSFVGSGTSIAVTTEYKRYSTTFEWNPVNLDAAELVIYVAGSAGQYLTIKNVKVEIGNKATDWSPAPEDLASQTQITALNNLISQKVSNDQYQSDKTQTANLISQTVTNAVSNISVGGTNLLKNSKFDDNMNNWHIWCPKGMGTSTVQINPTGGVGDWPRQAIYLAKIINPQADKNNQFGIAQDNIPVEPNAEYTFQLFNDGIDPITVQHGNGSNDPYVSKVLGSLRTTWTFKIPAGVYNTNIYIGFDSGQSGTAWISLTKLEKGNKVTDWSLSPFDTATSTEIDQINNAIKLKADSSDVTSQIAVATSGIQNTVNNKADKSQITQLANQITSVVSDINEGKINLIVNGGFENGTDNWTFEDVSSWSINKNNGYQPFTEDYIRITPDGKGYITQKLVRFNGLSVSDWNFNFYYNIQNNVSGYVKAYLRIDYEDGTFKHINDTKLTANNAWQRMSVKINKADLSAVSGIYLRLQFDGASGGGSVYYSQFQISRGADDKPYTKSDLDNANQSQITQLKDDVNLRVSKNDVVNQINISNEGILIDGRKVHITGNTSIDNAVIKNTMIANSAINTAQIADAAINDAKIANLNGNKIVAGSIAANKIDVNDLIANGINTKTLTSVNLNTSTLTTPQLDLGLNGTFTEDFDYTQATTMFLPKKNKGTLTFNHGVLQSEGNMQTYVGGQWGGMNDSLVFQSGINNSQWTEVAPGYIKLDLYKQNGTDIAQRTYSDPTGFYYTSTLGDKSYLGNVLQTAQVQTASVLTKYIGPSDGQLRLQIGSNGNDYGLQVGSYAGSEAVLSDFIYNSTFSASPNVYITSGGHLMRTTSASKYKYNIKNPDIETTLGDRLLNVHLATWNDKRAVDSYAEQLSTGEEREKSSIDKYYGLIAEQLRDAGLDMFIDYGKNHEIEGIRYDRAWIPLLSVIRRLNDKVNEYELRISKLEGKINE